MINVPPAKIDKGVIEGLIRDQVSESTTLDYKEKLSVSTSEDKKEFVRDVSAFANAVGGDLVYGISERRENNRHTALPDKIVGLGAIDRDETVRKLESMMRDSIEPRINGVQVRWVGDFDGIDGPVLVLRIPKSYLAPHMIKTGESRFYSRNNGGKWPLDVTEIRSAFALSESLPEKVRRFRDERIGRIVAEETPIPLISSPKTILHLLPVASLEPTTRIDTAPLAKFQSDLRPISAWHLNASGSRHNLEGFLVTGNTGRPSVPMTYTQVFRSGAIEAVDCTMLLRVMGSSTLRFGPCLSRTS